MIGLLPEVAPDSYWEVGTALFHLVDKLKE